MVEDQMFLFSSQIVKLPVKKIRTNRNQPRKYFDKNRLHELARSIEQHGIIQPLVVRDNRGETVLVAGERRLRACQIAGLEEVPVFFIQGDPMELALIENIQRENLLPIEEAEALGHIQTQKEYTQIQLSAIVGKAQNTVSEVLALNKLPEAIRDTCRKDPRWSRSMLLKIARKKNEAEMETAFKAMLDKLNEEETEEKLPPVNKPTQNALVTLKRIGVLEKNFDKLDFDSIKPETQREIKSQLQSLQKKIRVMLKSL